MTRVRVLLPSEKALMAVPESLMEMNPSFKPTPDNHVIFLAPCPACDKESRWYGMPYALNGTTYDISHMDDTPCTYAPWSPTPQKTAVDEYGIPTYE